MALARAVTRGHPAALSAFAGWLPDRVPHAILISGPASVGKTTLALDLAAALLCDAAVADERPCRACPSCRRVASGNHPDVHRLRPGGPGWQIRIGGDGGSDGEGPGVRDLVAELVLLPAEGRTRIGIVEAAHRMNEAAQHALLRTLEEPPGSAVIVLCADDDDRLLPTIRSRCARVRLGPVGVAAIEALLEERGAADAPTAARLARISGGRPGMAVALARRPAAVRAREELVRRLVDLAAAGPADRLVATPSLLAGAKDVAAALVATEDDGDEEPATTTSRGRGKRSPAGKGGRSGARAESAARLDPTDPDEAGTDDASPQGDVDGSAGEPVVARRGAPAERRNAARALVDVWRALARDLAVASRGGQRELRETAIIEEVVALAARLPDGAALTFLARLDATERLLEGNASPDLAIDTLLLAWPRTTR